jgi:hypothetical protein
MYLKAVEQRGVWALHTVSAGSVPLQTWFRKLATAVIMAALLFMFLGSVRVGSSDRWKK